MIKRNFQLLAYLLSFLVLLVGFIAWGQGFEWRFDELSAYDLFPLFGIMAFSLMWAHYIVSAKALYLGVSSEKTKSYFSYTSLAVLVALLLHPGILVWRLWRDGFGLPPNSYLANYVAVGSQWAAILGTLALIIFLAYEFHRKFSKKRWWKFVTYASDVAMVFVFFHALKLGPELQMGWFRMVWFFYGVSYLIAVVYLRLSKKLNEEAK